MFNKVIVAVVGSSNSGKTTAVEHIVKGLTKQGYTVASAKRIPEQDFTIDTKGKDTYRHAKAGSTTVISVAPNELATIKKVDTKKLTLEQLISEIPDETDVIIVEGFKELGTVGGIFRGTCVALTIRKLRKFSVQVRPEAPISRV